MPTTRYTATRHGFAPDPQGQWVRWEDIERNRDHNAAMCQQAVKEKDAEIDRLKTEAALPIPRGTTTEYTFSCTPENADGPVYGFGQTLEDAVADWRKAYNELKAFANDPGPLTTTTS